VRLVGIGDVEEEDDPGVVLLDEPLVDNAVEVEANGVANLGTRGRTPPTVALDVQRPTARILVVGTVAPETFKCTWSEAVACAAADVTLAPVTTATPKQAAVRPPFRIEIFMVVTSSVRLRSAAPGSSIAKPTAASVPSGYRHSFEITLPPASQI
jgi:hypothetical protein